MNKAIIFDYGGTLDTNSTHWSWVLWDAYQKEGVDISLAQFRECYVHAERELEHQPLIQPQHNMLDLLRIKVDIETRFLAEQHYIDEQEVTRRAFTEHIALRCYNQTSAIVRHSALILRHLVQHYQLAMVSNFYGNIHAVMRDFDIEQFFQVVVESAVVGVRKPDPSIFRIAVDALHLKAEDTIVVGDSYKNDIAPATAIGCRTIWIRGREWDDSSVKDIPVAPTATITHIDHLPQAVNNIGADKGCT